MPIERIRFSRGADKEKPASLIVVNHKQFVLGPPETELIRPLRSLLFASDDDDSPKLVADLLMHDLKRFWETDFCRDVEDHILGDTIHFHVISRPERIKGQLLHVRLLDGWRLEGCKVRSQLVLSENPGLSEVNNEILPNGFLSEEDLHFPFDL
jgi:hypothetical protein